MLFLADLIAAALTFAAVASVPFWRRSAITAPVFVFLSAPMTSLLILITFAPATRWINLGSKYQIALLVSLALSAVSIATAYVAVLTCRFVLQILAPRVEQLLGLRSFLVLQAAILSGGTLSLLVLLVLFPNIARMIWISGPHWASILAGLIGALGVLACLLALLRLRAPEQYLPKPLPNFITQLISRRSEPT